MKRQTEREIEREFFRYCWAFSEWRANPFGLTEETFGIKVILVH